MFIQLSRDKEDIKDLNGIFRNKLYNVLDERYIEYN